MSDATTTLPQLAVTSVSGGLSEADIVGLGVELDHDEGVRLTMAIAEKMMTKNQLYRKNEQGDTLFIKTAALRKKDKITYERFDMKLRTKNGNSDIFILATLIKRKTRHDGNKVVNIKSTWHLNVTCNPNHWVTKSKALKVLTANGQELNYRALVRTQVVGFLDLLTAFEGFGIEWKPNASTIERIQNGDVYLHAIEVAGHSKPLKAKHALQAERILHNVLTATDAGRNPKKGAVLSLHRSVADCLHLTVKPIVRAKGDTGEQVIKGLSIGVQSNKGNRSLDATMTIKLVPDRASGGRCFLIKSKITREYFEKIPTIAATLLKEDRRLMLRDVLALGCNEDGDLVLLGDNRASQRSFFEALTLIRKELLEERLRLNTLVWVEEGAWQQPLKELATDPDFSKVLRFWRDGKELSKEERSGLASRATFYRRLQSLKKRGLDTSLPHWLYVMREEAVTASFGSERQRAWAAINRGAKLPSGMHRSSEANRRKFFAASKGLVGSLHRVWDDSAELAKFDVKAR